MFTRTPVNGEGRGGNGSREGIIIVIIKYVNLVEKYYLHRLMKKCLFNLKELTLLVCFNFLVIMESKNKRHNVS